MYAEEDYLAISGLQHFAFCPRQWALIHIERQWAENWRTVEGDALHERTHDEDLTETRGDLVISRGMRVMSRRLGISGQCDVVEFHLDEGGITLFGRDGRWQPYPVEYKRGRPKEHDADRMQLCAQAICLEEMLLCEIAQGSLFYGEPRRRERVDLTLELRTKTEDAIGQMREYYARGYTPKPKPAARCRACSLNNICLPKLVKTTSINKYMKEALEEDGI